jgi:hypothetical protein
MGARLRLVEFICYREHPGAVGRTLEGAALEGPADAIDPERQTAKASWPLIAPSG